MSRPYTSRSGKRLRFTPTEQDEIVRRYRAGESCNAIARDLDCSHKSLTLFLERLGVEVERRWPSGQDHPNWEGGRYTDREGYVSIRLSRGHARHGMVNAVGQVREHRLVMAESLGRDLHPDETVHHKNGNRADNRLSNLELMTSLHPAGQRARDQVQFAMEVLRRYAPHLLTKKGERNGAA